MAGTTYITSMSGISMWNLWVFDWLTAARRGGGGEDLALGKAFPTSRWFSTLSRLNVTSPPGPALLHHRDSSETAGKDNKTRPGKMRATSSCDLKCCKLRVNFVQLAEFLPFTAQPNDPKYSLKPTGKYIKSRPDCIRSTTPHHIPHLPVPIPPVTILHPADPSFNLPSSPRLPPDFETFRCPIDRTNITGPAREPEMHMKSDEKWSLHWAEHLQDPVQRCTWRIGTARAILGQDDVFELFISERSETSFSKGKILNSISSGSFTPRLQPYFVSDAHRELLEVPTYMSRCNTAQNTPTFGIRHSQSWDMHNVGTAMR
ncbi:uncharacterized protein CLUP02_06111 [Colletotrichum lupini]|uniref:Uncharacterized protein n=1 Tax=Colletotrichum lupini TaxID=145971 RepID=A0A9Q8SP28_9PEZI|nr:uncharacterized protein CLUP02_06111 [Colletotrichum lupini]UQC80628.1 hypothetical protein CLUP02_06111 [Colletotrichum lupini]